MDTDILVSIVSSHGAYSTRQYLLKDSFWNNITILCNNVCEEFVYTITEEKRMVSKKIALEEAKKIRATGKNAKIVLISKGLGPGVKTYMIMTSKRK